MQGSYHPAAAQPPPSASAPNDPRPSIDDRYREKDHYVGQVTKAAHDFVQERYLLDEDLRVIENAARHWDYVMSAATSSAQR